MEYEHLHITPGNLPELVFPAAEFYQCTFENCNFISGNFRDSHFNECLFKHCIISLVNIEGCRFQSVDFYECKITGLDFSVANDFLLQISFDQCKIEGCGFAGLQLALSKFCKCEINQSDFFAALLTESDFSNSKFEHTIFQDTDLRKADFTGATGYEINPLENKLRGARFSLPEAASMFRHIGIIIEK